MTPHLIGAVKRFLWRWLRRLPSPFTSGDFKAGYGNELAFRQFEISDTRVFDRLQAMAGCGSKGVIRDHLGVGRPDQVALVFGRRITTRHGDVSDPGDHERSRTDPVYHLQVLTAQAVLQ